MQKHERQALAAAQAEAERLDLVLTHRRTSKRHLLLVIDTPMGPRAMSIGTSPGDRDIQTSYACQWVRRVGRELGRI